MSAGSEAAARVGRLPRSSVFRPAVAVSSTSLTSPAARARLAPRVLRGLSDRPDPDRREPRPVRSLSRPAQLKSSPVRRLPQARRARGRELLARALPLGRPRPQREARPIKGTAPRSADPVDDEATRKELPQDEKTFAEHLMIVDLLRNDLGRVCEVDTVRVPELMVDRAVRHRAPDDLQRHGTLEAGASRSTACAHASPAAR